MEVTIGLAGEMLALGGIASEADLAEFARMGVRPLSNDVLLAAIAGALGEQAEAELIVADVDWNMLAPILEARRVRPVLDRVRPLRATPVAPASGGWVAQLREAPSELRRPLLVLAGGFLVSVLALQGAAVATFGAETVRTHVENMVDHNQPRQLSSRRIGLALAMSTPPLSGIERHTNLTLAQKVLIESQQPLRYGIAAVLVLTLGWAVRRLRDDEAYAYGFLPFFWITTASYYYYVARVTLILAHAADFERSWRHRVGLAMLFAMEVYANQVSVTMGRHRMILIGTLAWMLVAYGLVQLVWMELEARAKEREESGRTPHDTPEPPGAIA
jgi:hypothetical protein